MEIIRFLYGSWVIVRCCSPFQTNFPAFTICRSKPWMRAKSLVRSPFVQDAIKWLSMRASEW